jgi:hypothetical protein
MTVVDDIISDEVSREQLQTYESIGRSRFANQILSNWIESVDRVTSEPPESFGPPPANSPLKPGVLSEPLLDFVQRLVSSQEHFVIRLIEAVAEQSFVNDPY